MDNQKSKLESGTIRNAIKLIIINGLVLIAAVTGKTFDIEGIQEAIDTWLPIVMSLLNIWLGNNVIKGRVDAKDQIDPESSILPWRKK